METKCPTGYALGSHREGLCDCGYQPDIPDIGLPPEKLVNIQNPSIVVQPDKEEDWKILLQYSFPKHLTEEEIKIIENNVETLLSFSNQKWVELIEKMKAEEWYAKGPDCDRQTLDDILIRARKEGMIR